MPSFATPSSPDLTIKAGTPHTVIMSKTPPKVLEDMQRQELELLYRQKARIWLYTGLFSRWGETVFSLKRAQASRRKA